MPFLKKVDSRWTIVRKKGFTLIELLVVISIIGILAAFAVASFSSAQARARDAERKNDLDQITKALQMYYNDHNTYPISGWWHSATGGGWDNLKTALEPTYIKKLPADPKNNFIDWPWTIGGSTSYYYGYWFADWCSSNFTAYILTTHLEQPGASAGNSVPIGTCNWAVTDWYTKTND